MTDKKGKVVFGLAFGQHLLCGSGYRKDDWNQLCQNEKKNQDRRHVLGHKVKGPGQPYSITD